MQWIKKMAAACLALAMVWVLAGCNESGISTVDATALVKGNLDEIYLGVFDPDYLKSVDITENQAEETYLNGLETEAKYCFYYYSYTANGDSSYNYVTDEQLQDMIDAYKEIYSYSRYTVQPAVKQSDGTFAVKVVFEPLDIHVQVDDEWEQFGEDFFAQYDEVDLEGMSDTEFQTWMEEEFFPTYNQAIIDLVKSKIPTIGYEDETSVVIQVVQDEDGYFTMDDNGFDTFDRQLVVYP